MSVPNNNPQRNGYPGTQSPQGPHPTRGVCLTRVVFLSPTTG